MGSVNKCNISLLDSYYQQFSDEKDKFNSTAYKTFSSSYLTRCNDYNIVKMKNNLEKVYFKINKGYKNIDLWWNSYDNDMKGVEIALSNDSKTSSIKEGLLRNFITGQLPSLRNFNVTFSDLVSNKPLSTLPNSVFINNTVVSSVGVSDIFASVYKEFEDGKAILKKGDKEATKIKPSKFNESSLSNDNFLEATGAFVLDGAESLFNTVNQGFSDVSNWWNNEAVPWINDAHQVVNNVLDSAGAFISSAGNKIVTGFNDLGKFWADVKSAFGEIALGIVEGDFERVGATIANIGISFVEGLLQFGEAIIDFATIAYTINATLFTSVFDIGQAIYGRVTGNEWSSATKVLWNQTMGFVSEKHVTSWFDSFYENNWIGQFIKQNSYSFDTFRSLSSGVGYTSGVVILTIATLGAGGAAVAGSAATTSGAVAATSATQMSVVAGLAGIGRGTENAWANGAGAVEGLVAGGLTGLWEGFQFYVGGKISNFQMLKGASTFGSKFFNSMGRVVLDGVDGGAEGLVQPFINMIYADGYYDENGNYIEFTANDNIFERYGQLFDDNGGFGAVFTNAAVGSASSAIGEVFDLRKYFNQEKSNVTNNVDVVGNVDNLSSNGLRQSNINIEEQIAAANYYTGEGNFYTIKVNSLDDIPKDIWSKIDDPSSVYVMVGDKVMTVGDAKGETILSQHKKASVDISSIEEQIAAANYYTGEGNFYTIKVNSLDDIPKDIWSKIDNPSNVYISVGNNTILASNLQSMKQYFSAPESYYVNKLNNLNYANSGFLKNMVNYFKSNLDKYFYKNTNMIEGLNQEILNNGLYHFSDNIDQIMQSSYLKKSGVNASYGNPKTFFFNGIPEIGAYVHNLDKLQLKTTAIKIVPTEEILNSNNFKVRFKDDGAITFDGNFVFNENTIQSIQKEYFVLKIEDDKLVYEAVPKVVYDNYEITPEAQALKKYLASKGNIEAIRSDYLLSLTNRSTAAYTSSSVTSTFLKSNEMFSAKNELIFDLNHHISSANQVTSSGGKYTFKFKSIDDIPMDFWDKISNPELIRIEVDGHLINHNNLYNRNSYIRNKILSSVQELKDPVLIARKLYFELNKVLHYDIGVRYSGTNKMQETLNNIVNFDNLNENNAVVCKGWSELYYDLLISAGFSPNDVNIVTTGKHWWIEIKNGSDNVIIADATEAINGSIDLAACKAGYSPNGFAIVNSSYSRNSLKRIYQYDRRIFLDNKKLMYDIDQKLGYVGANGYLLDEINTAQSLFSDNLFSNLLDNNAANVIRKIVFDCSIPSNMDGYEIFAYYKYIINNNFKSISNKFSLSTAFFKINGGLEPVNLLKYVDGENTIYQVYSQTLGKHIFESQIEYETFLSKNKIILTK